VLKSNNHDNSDAERTSVGNCDFNKGNFNHHQIKIRQKIDKFDSKQKLVFKEELNDTMTMKDKFRPQHLYTAWEE